MGYSPWSGKELDMPEQLIREGNGNPLQCSCLENPMDRGAQRATVHSAAQSWIRLKGLGMHACMYPTGN